MSFTDFLYLKPKSGKEKVLQTHLVIEEEKLGQEKKREGLLSQVKTHFKELCKAKCLGVSFVFIIKSVKVF